jgi:hypothetical protein
LTSRVYNLKQQSIATPFLAYGFGSISVGIGEIATAQIHGDRASILPNWKKKSITHHWFALAINYKKKTGDKNPKVGEFVIG